MLRRFHGPGTRSGKLIAIYSSDVRYFDVMDMRHPVPEAYELVEGWRAFVGQLPWLHLRQHRAPLGDAESQVFESTTAATAAAGLASDSSL